MKISDERLSALVGFVYQGIKQLTPEDRVAFLSGLGQLMCLECGEDLKIGERCYCSAAFDG